MLGCSSEAPRVASRRNRSRRIALAATSGGRTLTATMWPSVRWRARNTAPMPPVPARLNTSYRSLTARWTSSRTGSRIRGENVAALAGGRTVADNRGAMPDASGVSVRGLGPAQVTVGAAPAPLARVWRNHLAPRGYLARVPRKSRTREHLIGLLW